MKQTNATHDTQQKPLLDKRLIYAAIALLIINFMFIFLPFMEMTEKGKVSILGGVQLKSYTYSAINTLIVIPTTLIPYLIYVLLFIPALKKKNPFLQLNDDTHTKPLRFLLLKFASCANLFVLLFFVIKGQEQIRPYKELGAYCTFTFLGVLNLIFTTFFIVVLFMLSKKSEQLLSLRKQRQEEEQAKKQSDTTLAETNILNKTQQGNNIGVLAGEKNVTGKDKNSEEEGLNV